MKALWMEYVVDHVSTDVINILLQRKEKWKKESETVHWNLLNEDWVLIIVNSYHLRIPIINLFNHNIASLKNPVNKDIELAHKGRLRNQEYMVTRRLLIW